MSAPVKNRLIYVHGKPVKFMRFGGLSPVPQKNDKSPAKRGVYAFTWPYIDLFLVSASYSGIGEKYAKFEYVKDKAGNKVTDKHPEFEKFVKQKNWEIWIGTEEAPAWVLVKPKHPKVFEYFGHIWHHLGSHLKPDQILDEYTTPTGCNWWKSTYFDFCYALKKDLHNMAREPLGFLPGDKTQRWTYSNNPTVNWDKQDLEVFIERI